MFDLLPTRRIGGCLPVYPCRGSVRILVGDDHGYRTGLTATPSPESYVSSDPASRVFKIFMAIYETNQTDWNQSNFW